ncbi:class I adenylate-forming enzyme family protein [Roseibium sediminis]|uniref:class I adenylate-forming enzyme family protein n=1 Tax=Roseibium sediminis TaxID=1775174 RepID=UPI00123D880A|nr:AMP-binding protein [Roseibium sediminis]
MNMVEWLHRAANLYPANPAVLSGTNVLATYREFRERACKLASGLKSRYAILPGDRVALFLSNHPSYLEILYAVWQLGAVVVPINYKLHAREAGYILQDSAARLVFVGDPDTFSNHEDAVPEGVAVIAVGSSDYGDLSGCSAGSMDAVSRSADDLAWLFYTSGTTGRPKGVMISHGNIQAMSLSYFADVDQVGSEDTILYAAPMSHGAGLYNFMHVLKGAAHCISESGGFDPAEILALSKEFGSVHMFAAPTMVKRLVEEARRQGSKGEGIRTVVYGGAPMYVADILEATEVMGSRFVQIYGQGECPMCITSLTRELVMDRSHKNWKQRLGSVGRAQSCVEVRIVGEDGAVCRPGEPGEITVKGPAVMLGYWQNPDATASSIREGWLYTGDVGHLDEDGFLTLTDRSKDVIISGGTNIYPREVEEVLLQLDCVSEVSVVGQPDAEWGEVIVAFVVCAKGRAALPEDLDRHCLDNMARFKRPKRYVLLKELPKNSYGKVLKTELRKQLEEN